jgi:hypothetical protein
MEIKWKSAERSPETQDNVNVLREDGSIGVDNHIHYHGWFVWERSKVVAWAHIPTKEEILNDIED